MDSDDQKQNGRKYNGNLEMFGDISTPVPSTENFGEPFPSVHHCSHEQNALHSQAISRSSTNQLPQVSKSTKQRTTHKFSIHC
jgi:hypothetical protein